VLLKKLFFTLFLVILVSCDDKDYGKKISKFVDNDVPGLSIRMAKAGINEKIHNAYILEYSSLILKANNIHQKLMNSKKDPVDFSNLTMKESQSFRIQLLEQESESLTILRDIDQIEFKIKKLETVCTTMDKSFLKELITAEVFQVTIPQTDDRYFLSTDIASMIEENITSLVSSINQDKQNGIMEEALIRVEEKLPSEEILKKMFLENCNKVTQIVNTSESGKSFSRLFSNIKVTANTYYDYIYSQISYAGRRINKLALDSLANQYNLDEIREYHSKSIFEEKLFKTYQNLIDLDFKLIKEALGTTSKLEYFKLQRKWFKLNKSKKDFLHRTKGIWSHYDDLSKQQLTRELRVKSLFKLIQTRRYL